MCRNGPVSSSRTGSTPKTRVYQASLTDRSVTVTATCEMAGMVPEMATMIVLCSLWRCLRPQRYGEALPGNFREASPGQRVLKQELRHLRACKPEGLRPRRPDIARMGVFADIEVKLGVRRTATR